MIRIQNLCKTYRGQSGSVTALQDINFNVNAGQIVGIIGESGAGKSTLLRTINLLERPTSGQIFINAVELTALDANSLREIRRKISMIFQHFNLLSSRTVFENIALPLELSKERAARIHEKVTELLKLVKLTTHRDHYPHQLSGGQKQRVAIARALATNPEVLLCDEPTSALDNKSTASILNLIKEINKELNITVVIITHELEVIKQICRSAGVMHHGELIEYGSVINLFTQPKSNITRSLIQKSLHLELPTQIVKKLQTESSAANSSPIVRFTFTGSENSDQPLISGLIKNYDITVNIIQANIEQLQDTTVGYTICEISGLPENISKALDSITSQNLKVEVLGYV